MAAAPPSDRRLVEGCLNGSEEAWRSLVDRYQKLVYAVIMKYRPGSEAAADLFQAIWLDVYNDLPTLRDRDAVKPWLMAIVRNKCFHWKKKQSRVHDHEVTGDETDDIEARAVTEADFADDLLRDQLVREAVSRLGDRCQELIHLLFFAKPPLPYKEAAERLGLATGSIGFIRGRCLRKLQKRLEELDAV
ncbi:MAG: sigma-70 family RNA polymerase sigma factor [Acidobacteriota bacterium]